MAATAEKTDPALWERIKEEVQKGDKGGDPGEWSARKAQLAVSEYKKAGGGYKGKKTADNHLVQWEQEEWGTKSGKPSKETGERYLPKEAREKLTDSEYKRTTAKKRADTAKGKQFSAQPKDVERRVAPTRHAGASAAGKAASSKQAAGKPSSRAPSSKAKTGARTGAKAPAKAGAKVRTKTGAKAG